MDLSIGMLWLIAGVVLCILEIFSMAFVLLSFGAAALVAAVAAGLGADGTFSLAVFAIAAALMIFALRPLAVRRINAKPPEETNAAALVGLEAYVTKRIDPIKGGRVHLRGDDWQAKADEPLAVNARVRVQSVSGVTLFVTRVEEEQVGSAASI